jgi:hypothetical protein
MGSFIIFASDPEGPAGRRLPNSPFGQGICNLGTDFFKKSALDQKDILTSARSKSIIEGLFSKR